MDKTATMSKEELIATMSAMQAQMNEMSKTLTLFKNELKDKKAKAAKKKLKASVVHSMSCKELTEMADYLQDALFELGTVDTRMFPEKHWVFLKELWHDYKDKSINKVYDLSQLWARVRSLNLAVRFENYGAFVQFLDA